MAEFRDPGSKCRGAPFWAWNGKLEPDELRRQIRLMHRMGLGGFFMHSRIGLDTGYLSEEWFDCVAACIDEADKLDMQAWLYDEDRWPSGAAGGLVTRNPKYRSRSLAMDVIESPGRFRWGAETLAAFTARIDGASATDVKRLARGRRPGKLERGRVVLAFRVAVAACNSWFNGYTYLDTLSHQAVAEFIRVTHEAYRKRFGRHLGRRVPGIFTDEPNFGGPHPWTDSLPATFRKRYGYDIVPHLPELFFNVDGQEMTPARWQYHDCVTFLFVEAFAQQIGRWCQKNDMQHTGHALAEETLASQTSVVGSCMRFYEHMQAPGMDILTEHQREYDTAKQVSSAARQFGRKWRLTETYGCTGWDFPFAGHKAVGDWQAALGINLRCQHLSWYTMEGEAKRDYPAGIFYQSPWWELYPKVEDYFARIHAVMTRGAEVRDLLIVHPVESMWTLVRNGWRHDPAVAELDRMIVALRDSLLAGGIDFDYGDEDILARHGRAGSSRGEPVLRVGKATYKAVVVPPLRTIRRTTLELLRKFQAAGGTVVFAGRPPQHVDAQPCTCAAELARECTRAPAAGPKLPRAVEAVARRIAVTDGHGKPIAQALHLLREDAEAFYLFVCNSGHRPAQLKPTIYDATMVRDRQVGFEDVRIRGFADCAGSPVELDPDTGEIFAAAAHRRQSGWEIRTSLPPLGSRLLVIPKARSRKTWPPRPRSKHVRTTTLRPRRWDIVLSESNALVLDRPRYRIGDRPWKKADDILRVDAAVRDELGIARRAGRMVQPWARPRPVPTKSTTVTLVYEFDVRTLPSGELALAIERPDTFMVAVNGKELSMAAECGWWCDRSLRRIPVDPGMLRLGRNEIVLTCCYDELHPGLEAAYLLGNFGVKVGGTDVSLTAAPTSLAVGDWVKQGLPFYSGSVAYCRKVHQKLRGSERLFVQVPEYRGVAVRVLAGGEAAGLIAWPPNEVDVTDFLDDGAVDLRIEVIGHRRNSHGPLHLNEKWPRWTGPGQFTASGEGWIDAYQLVPCGLMAPPRLIVRKRLRT